jgi:hypothetical protein
MLKCRKIAMESCWQRDMTAHHSALYNIHICIYIIYLFFSFFLITIFYQQFLPATFPLVQPLPCASKMPGDKICRSLRSRAKSRQDSESAPGLERRWSHEFHCNPLKRNEWNWISLRMPADREDHNFDHLSTCNILVNTSHMVERIVPVENGACCVLGSVLPRISKGILKTLMSASKVQRLFCRLFYRISPKAAQFHALLALLGRRMS